MTTSATACPDCGAAVGHTSTCTHASRLVSANWRVVRLREALRRALRLLDEDGAEYVRSGLEPGDLA